MPIKVTCEKCGGVLHAPDDAGGKKGRCPNCQNILPIPFDATRAPAFGGSTGSTPNFGGGGPPAGMAFAAPASNPLLPNADTKRPNVPPPFGSGSRPDTPGLASSTPGLGLNATFGGTPAGSNPGVQSSMPFGAPRMGPSSAMPIAPERTGWVSAAGGLRWVQIGVILWALALIAVSGVSIFGMTAGAKAISVKAGFLKWNNLTQLNEIRFASFAIPAVLGSLAILIGRWRIGSLPVSSGARGAARWATLYTFVAVIGFLALIGMTVMGMKDGAVTSLTPSGISEAAETPIADRVTTYLKDTLMSPDQLPGMVQRYGLLALIVFGKMGELFFGCSLGRIGAHLRDGFAAGRVTGTYALYALIAVTLVVAGFSYELFGEQSARMVWGPKWWAIPVPTRTMIVSGVVIGVTLIGSILYLRMLGAVRLACRNAGA